MFFFAGYSYSCLCLSLVSIHGASTSIMVPGSLRQREVLHLFQLDIYQTSTRHLPDISTRHIYQTFSYFVLFVLYSLCCWNGRCHHCPLRAHPPQMPHEHTCYLTTVHHWLMRETVYWMRLSLSIFPCRQRRASVSVSAWKRSLFVFAVVTLDSTSSPWRPRVSAIVFYLDATCVDSMYSISTRCSLLSTPHPSCFSIKNTPLVQITTSRSTLYLSRYTHIPISLSFVFDNDSK